MIDLGKRLVTELNLADDLLAQWMAHFIAERIDAAERATPEARVAAQEACAQAIYGLWEHRNSLPRHTQPFRELEPILRTLASLDVDSGNRFRYIHSRPDIETPEDAELAGNRFLDTAVNLDYSARVLIQYLLGIASLEVSENVAPWLDAAVEAGADATLEVRIADFLSGSANLPDPDELARKALQEKVEKLEVFSQLASSVAVELRSQLAAPDANYENESD
ncbi:AVAST type 3 anti-phage proein Avs3b [Paraburkholderia caribensis]|uniref:AVAST type 3 anti-phage proein Avs3b n=1 Tax=Paraburkholderia caribensis TaxID=75105 RepID=UPI00078B9DC1|nr:AVAST type 3 anti-phage proein Avs3b [Paraburkholderia caribensis]AMV48213.1 hypothetical protein ATN79_46965 [Paraburkholderia caribensis]